MIAYEFADVLTGLFEAIMMFMLIEIFCTRKEKIRPVFYGLGIVFLAVLINLSNYIFNFGMLNAVGMSLAIFLLSFLYNAPLTIRAVISLFGILFLAVVEIVILFLVTLLFDVTVTVAVNNQSLRLLGIITSKLTTFAILNVIRIMNKGHQIQTNSSYWSLFFLIFANSIVAVFLIFKLSYDLDMSHMNNLSIVCSVGLMFSTFFALYLYDNLTRQAMIINKQKQDEQHYRTQIKHLDEIVMAQKQLKKFKHDFKNHTVALNGYLCKGDCNGALEYINMINGMFKENIVETTGNTALDAIISTKKAIAESRGIRFITKIQIPELIPFDAADICIIFGNALDNAIEACDRIDTGHKTINLTLINVDSSLFCKIENTSSKTNKHIGETIKKDKENHGFGLQNIKDTLAKFNSEPIIEYENGIFTLKFIIFTNK